MYLATGVGELSALYPNSSAVAGSSGTVVRNGISATSQPSGTTNSSLTAKPVLGCAESNSKSAAASKFLSQQSSAPAKSGSVVATKKPTNVVSARGKVILNLGDALCETGGGSEMSGSVSSTAAPRTSLSSASSSGGGSGLKFAAISEKVAEPERRGDTGSGGQTATSTASSGIKNASSWSALAKASASSFSNTTLKSSAMDSFEQFKKQAKEKEERVNRF
ncbi:unnamed protein product [Soboliphyme baturini]|uniref:P17/29C-like protein DDB_G0287399 n=1 Tax=Soboliphyme baturini TaxID=241478 RepID=A0A183I987_9BILA|nr:unnamed protein product [Soboliphyme baturini]